MILSEINNSTLIITLNNPEKRNALHPDMISKLISVLNENENNSIVKSVIITGAGSAFCAGADLKYLKQLNDFSTIENQKDSESIAELMLSVYNYSKPVIAAVNGPAIAGGCGLASVCDLVVAHPDKSKFGYTEVKIGFIPAIVSFFLIRRAGESIAKQMLLTGEIITGRRAYETGFVNYLSDDVLSKSLEIAETLNANSSQSIFLTKKLIKSISGMEMQSAIELSINMNTISRTSSDFRKGLSQFLNKE